MTDGMTELMAIVRTRAPELQAMTRQMFVWNPDGTVAVSSCDFPAFDKAVATCLARVGPAEKPFAALQRAMRLRTTLSDPLNAAELRDEIVRVIVFGD